jgi:hypothetical protein
VLLLAIRDGLSNTLLVGEKHVPYGKFGQGWFDNSLYNGDTYFSSTRAGGLEFPLARSVKEDRWCFGSYHPQLCQFAFGDGSVHVLSSSINPRTLGLLANRNDGQVVPIDGY